MLAGIYAHTSSHVSAAPMAHFVATEKKNSRHRYSNPTKDLPCFYLEKFILGEPFNHRYRYKGKRKTRVPFNTYMDYVYRPDTLNDLCAYEYAMKVHVGPKNKQTNENFPLQDHHPFSDSDVAHLRLDDEICVPTFAWNFLPSAGSFQGSILHGPAGSENNAEKMESSAR